MPSNQLYFFDVPTDISAEWRKLFELMDADMNSRDSLLGRPKASVLKERREVLENMGIKNEFDAILSAEAQKERGNMYFRQGRVGRANALYFCSMTTSPLPSTFLNLAAVSLKQHMWLTAVMFCTRALAFKEVMQPATVAKTLYRRAVARRLLSHEGKYLREALSGKQNIVNTLRYILLTVKQTSKSRTLSSQIMPT
ncbi:hypothetical protein HWV62_31740 [Athelia sp. TMB]|nr:hypothetical protein HWV62_31740 [Athelia sp. TMB]